MCVLMYSMGVQEAWVTSDEEIRQIGLEAKCMEYATEGVTSEGYPYLSR